MNVAAIANFGKWALVASQGLKLSPAVAFFPADGRLGHFTHAHWSLLQTLDKPPASGPGRRLRLPHHRHRENQAIGWYVLDGERDKAPVFQVLAHRMQGHSAPAETVEQKMMLGEKIA